jgi:GNAT superfamily N-acetyltransferase
VGSKYRVLAGTGVNSPSAKAATHTSVSPRKNMKDTCIATKADIDELNSLISKVNADKTHDHKYCSLNLDDFEETGRKVIFVTRFKNQITGFLSLHCSRSFQDSDEATFEVFAHPDFKGMGFGSDLIDLAHQFLIKDSKIKTLKIGVLNNNPRAKDRYVKKGFTSLGPGAKGEDYYKNIRD